MTGPHGEAPLGKAAEVGTGVSEPSRAAWVLGPIGVLRGSLCSISGVHVGPSGDHPSPNSPFFCHPKRNYVFQRRYVRFDGKNLMYFSSEKVRGGRMRAGRGCTVLPN